MGITLALLAMLCFAGNIIIVRSAAARMSVDSGFTVMLSVNVLCVGAACAVQALLRDTPLVLQWRGVAWFVASGIIGIFLGRRMLLDTVVALGAARASVFHSSSPVFTLIGAWLIVGERLGAYELCLMAMVIVGLWITQLTGSAQSPVAKLPSVALSRGMLVGFLAIAGFGMGNALRGVAMRTWDEAIFGTLIATAAALLCHLASVRDWGKVGVALRSGDRRGLVLFAGSGLATGAGSMLTTSAMHYMEIAIATLVTFTTPLVIFPVTVFVFGNREGLSWRSASGAAMVLAGIVLLALR
jgi:drug/metabolite transporter (DMT)-like permease